MKFIVIPSIEGNFMMEISREELEMARKRALDFILTMDSDPVIGDQVKLAFALLYTPNYFMSKTVVYFGRIRKWMKGYFKDSRCTEEKLRSDALAQSDCPIPTMDLLTVWLN